MASTPHLTRPGDGYVSEFDAFLQRYLDQHSEVLEEQQRGWYIWWDQQVDLDELARQREDTVPERPYHYE